MEIGDSLQLVSAFIAESVRPLSGLVEDEDAARALLASLGFLDVPAIPRALLDLQLSLDGVLSANGDLVEEREKLATGDSNETNVTAALANVAAQVTLVVNDVHRLPGAFASTLPSDYLQTTSIADEIEKRLFDALVFNALEVRFGTLKAALRVLGIVEEFELDEDPNKHQPKFTLRRVNWDRIGTALQGPDAVMRDVYGWGTPAIDADRLFDELLRLSHVFLSPAEIQYPTPAFLNAVAPGATIPGPDVPVPMLVLPISSGSGATFALAIMPAPKKTDAELQGLGLSLAGFGSFSGTIPIADSLDLEITADADLTVGVGGILRPGSGLSLVTDPDGTPVKFAGAEITGKLAYRQTGGGEPIRLITFPGGAFIEATELFVKAGVDARGGTPDLSIAAGIDAGKFVFSPGSSDGFTKSLLPSTPLELDFSLGINWSEQRGVYLTGSGALEFELPIHQTIGPFLVDSIKIRIGIDGNVISLRVGILGGATLGPVTAIVDSLAVEADLTTSPGNLGPFGLDLGFKAPRGYGIVVDAGAVTGGGFLLFEDKRYSGFLQLSVFSISVKAFGVIDTELPGGKSGFSFVIIIVAEFTPIQVGFGFTLNGVGGLLGINRSLVTEALSNAVRKGSLENLLFPHDPVRDAPAILSDLEAIYPATPQHYVLGPMAKLGWGTPTLITAELGIVIELPGPRIAVLGVAQAALPTRAIGLVKLNLAIAGVLDFPKKLFSLDASLYDSRVGSFGVTGDASFRMGFGDNPNFVFSIGGFNPSFKAPPNFPKLRRAAVDLGVNGNPSLTLSGYFALTSNTAQIGAAIRLYASGAGIELEGHVSFDALFVFSPFSFEADLDAGMSVSFHGIGIGIHFHGHLSGPSPYRVSGDVCVSILFWDACLGVSATFGKSERATLPKLDPWDVVGADPSLALIGLQDAVSDARNWSAVAPPSALSAVSLASSAPDVPPIDPVGAAQLRQKVVPLNQKLTKFGAFKPKGHDKFVRGDVSIGNVAVTGGITPVTDDFASDTFKEMSGAERLSAPPYDTMEAGFTLNPNVIHIGDVRPKDVQFDTVLLDGDRLDVAHPIPPYALTQRHLRAMLQKSAAGLGGVRRTGLLKYVDPTASVKVSLQKETFAVADACSFTPNHDVTASPTTHIQAALALEDHLLAHPADVGRFAVVPAYELGL